MQSAFFLLLLLLLRSPIATLEMCFRFPLKILENRYTPGLSLPSSLTLHCKNNLTIFGKKYIKKKIIRTDKKKKKRKINIELCRARANGYPPLRNPAVIRTSVGNPVSKRSEYSAITPEPAWILAQNRRYCTGGARKYFPEPSLCRNRSRTRLRCRKHVFTITIITIIDSMNALPKCRNSKRSKTLQILRKASNFVSLNVINQLFIIKKRCE